jgi:hypothetical protein
VTGSVRKKPLKKDSLLSHCLARAFVAEEGGEEAAAAKYGERAERLGKWTAVKAAVRLTPKASRVAAFVIMWAIAMREEGRDEFSITEYQRFWNEGERQAYRLQVEFRELWPEFDTPNELARQLVKHLDAKVAAKDAGSLATKLQVTV